LQAFIYFRNEYFENATMLATTVSISAFHERAFGIFCHHLNDRMIPSNNFKANNMDFFLFFCVDECTRHYSVLWSRELWFVSNVLHFIIPGLNVSCVDLYNAKLVQEAIEM
jgi:hypothetical protein